MDTRPIGSIKIGKRFRKDLGDIDSLAKSIANNGLFHPVVIMPNGTLIAGQRRLAACKKLGWLEIPVNAIPLGDVVRGEHDENVIRKDFLPSEAVAIARELEPIEKEKAKERMLAGEPCAESAQGGKTRNKVSIYTGMGYTKLSQAKQVVEAAESEPKKYTDLVEQMDRTGRVEGPYRTMRRRKEEETVLKLKPIEGKFRTIVIDPPWEYESDLGGRAKPEYALMSINELQELPIRDWASPIAHLYLWTTNTFLPKAFELVKHWKFVYKTTLTWVKPRYGMGSWFRSSTEHCLFAVNLRCGITTRTKDIATHFEAPLGKHSEKPDKIYEIAERASYPPYLDVFGREKREGWTVWGILNE